VSSPRATLALALLLAAGCARVVRYPLDDVPRLGGGPFAGGRLAVQELRDERTFPCFAPARPLFSQAAVIRRDGTDWYCNRDDEYEGRAVSQQVTAMLVEHLQATGLFAEVAAGDGGTAEYVLSGALERFEGVRARHAVAEALAAQMGLLGFVAAATQRARYRGDARLGGLRLVRTADGAVLWEGSAEGSVEGTGSVSASEVAVYHHAEMALRAAVNRLVAQLAEVRPR